MSNFDFQVPNLHHLKTWWKHMSTLKLISFDILFQTLTVGSSYLMVPRIPLATTICLSSPTTLPSLTLFKDTLDRLLEIKNHYVNLAYIVTHGREKQKVQEQLDRLRLAAKTRPTTGTVVLFYVYQPRDKRKMITLCFT